MGREGLRHSLYKHNASSLSVGYVMKKGFKPITFPSETATPESLHQSF